MGNNYCCSDERDVPQESNMDVMDPLIDTAPGIEKETDDESAEKNDPQKKPSEAGESNGTIHPPTSNTDFDAVSEKEQKKSTDSSVEENGEKKEDEEKDVEQKHHKDWPSVVNKIAEMSVRNNLQPNKDKQ